MKKSHQKDRWDKEDIFKLSISEHRHPAFR